MAWVVTASLARLMADFRTTFPNKDRESDGTVGDLAHQAETSGHNPDDTAGSRSEYTDADSKAEVRAIDVDNDLRAAGVSMQNVIDRMLQTSADLRRLRYIIYNRVIWSRSNDWRPRAYTGSSPHTEHAHFSGDPGTDEDSSPWSSVLSFLEDDMEQSNPLIAPWSSNTVGNALAVVMETRKGLWVDGDSTGYGAPAPASVIGTLYRKLDLLNQKVENLPMSQLPQEAVNAAVAAALADPATVAALVKAINDDAARRAAE